MSIGLAYLGQTPNCEVECIITKAGDASTKVWAKWQPDENAFLTARGNLFALDETACWETVEQVGDL